MENKKNESVIDEIARDRGLTIDDLKQNAKKSRKPDLWKRILIVAFLLSVYVALAVCIFLFKEYALIFILVLVVFCVLLKPLINLLKKVFKVRDNDDLG